MVHHSYLKSRIRTEREQGRSNQRMRRTDTCELRELPCEGYQIISLNTCVIRANVRESNDAAVFV